MQEKLFGIITAIVLAAGCGGSNKHAESPTHEESVGDKAERAGENVEDATEQAAENAGEAAERAGDKIEKKTKDED